MSIVLERITKQFGSQRVVDDVSLEVADKELFVLLGSSGSGKSTILRIIAGLTHPTEGRVLLHGRDVTSLSPQDRGTGFVFQNYSIFRQMSVAENIEFGLRIRKTPREERIRKRDELLDLVGLTGLGNRYAHQLSGGQQQRVALARAMAYEPNVLLLDEPFGALDVKIRSTLRRSLKEIQRRFGVTTILVTHDQEEAFELADRIGVVDRGRLLEVDEGEGLYAQPKSLFAATFLGAGTVLVGHVENGRAKYGSLSLEIPEEVPHDEASPVRMLFRPEQVAVSEEEPTGDCPVLGKGTIVEEVFTGPARRLRLRLPRLAGTRQIAPAIPFGEEGLLVDAYVPSTLQIDGTEVWASLTGWTILKRPPPKLLVWDRGSGPRTALSIAAVIAERLGAETTVLAVSEGSAKAQALGVAVRTRQEEAGLAGADLRIRSGQTLQQIATEEAGSWFEMLILCPQTTTKSGAAGRKMPKLPGLEHRAGTRQLGELLMAILERANLPVLVARAERPAMNRVLICTAGGEPGKSDVRVGGRLARLLGATVTLFYATVEGTQPRPLTRSHLDQAASTLRSLDLEVEVIIRQAPTAVEGILEEARNGGHDLIIIGGHGPRSRSTSRITDVALQVLLGADRPVLVVPEERS